MQVFLEDKMMMPGETGTRFQNTAVALGCFDALHIGHQAIIKKVVDAAKTEGLTPLVYFFINQPRSVLSGQEIPSIYSLSKRLQILKELGVEVAVAKRFTQEYMTCSPKQFVEECLYRQLGAKMVSVGFNYRFGEKGSGNLQTLKELGEPLGIRVCGVDCVQYGDDTVSSTRIRRLIEEGKLEEATACLGRIFSIEGEVLSGNQIGRQMEFPTANLDLPQGQILPEFGVYLSQTVVDGKKYPSITNVGQRPTVEEGKGYIETHLLDYHGDLYGKKIEVAFCRYLREIQKFPDVQALRKQLEKDKAIAKKYF